LREQFNELVKWFIDPVRETNLPPPGYGYGRLWELMSEAFMIGSKGTVSDSAKVFFTPVIEGEMKVKLASDHGKKGSVKRRKKAHAWRVYALPLAKQIRATNPTLSQAELKAKIVDQWKCEIGCPTSQLVPAISAWEKSGDLPRRRK
jgi:hypothetical protein